MAEAQALWVTAPRVAALLATPFRPQADLLEIEALYSGISRGTEALVFNGAVPESEHERMRCPLQEGDLPYPVKYGYASVGVARKAGSRLDGRTVFVLHPHQDRYLVPEDMAVPLPEGVPAERAVLAANMETALNIVWDGRVSIGDRIAVVGAGVVGALAAWLASRVAGCDVTLMDINPERAALAAALGCRFSAPCDAPRDQDVVIHASASADGLATALECAGTEARVVEASWYGTQEVYAALGQAFHSRRLRLVSSQVGQVPAERRIRWTRRRRLETALGLLADRRLDALISGETEFSALAARYASILDDPATLCHRVRYPAAPKPE